MRRRNMLWDGEGLSCLLLSWAEGNEEWQEEVEGRSKRKKKGREGGGE